MSLQSYKKMVRFKSSETSLSINKTKKKVKEKE